MDGWTDGRRTADGLTDVQTDGWTDGWTDGRRAADGLTDAQTDCEINRLDFGLCLVNAKS